MGKKYTHMWVGLNAVKELGAELLLEIDVLGQTSYRCMLIDIYINIPVCLICQSTF